MSFGGPSNLRCIWLDELPAERKDLSSLPGNCLTSAGSQPRIKTSLRVVVRISAKPAIKSDH